MAVKSGEVAVDGRFSAQCKHFLWDTLGVLVESGTQNGSG